MPSVGIARAAFGSWKSPLSAKNVAAASNVYCEITLGLDGDIFFLERRPLEQGRNVLLRLKASNCPADLIRTDDISGNFAL